MAFSDNFAFEKKKKYDFNGFILLYFLNIGLYNAQCLNANANNTETDFF